MKRRIYSIVLLIILASTSCITKDGYKETEIFEEFETEQGFGVFHIPPVLFRIVFSLADEKEVDQFVSKDLLDKIDVIKVLFFDEKENTLSLKELNEKMKTKIQGFNYNLLTRIAQENNDISIYIIDKESVIREVLITIISDENYICLNVIGELSQDEVMQVYKSVNMKEILNYSN